MDRGLLLALMALQNDFISRDQFLLGFDTWLADRSRGVDAILVEKAFLTKSQRESLVSKLVTILEQSNNDWRMTIAGHTAVHGVYDAMFALARKDATAMNWVKLIGGELAIRSSADGTEKPDNGESGEGDPYGTVDFESLHGPCATLTNDKTDQSKE